MLNSIHIISMILLCITILIIIPYYFFKSKISVFNLKNNVDKLVFVILILSCISLPSLFGYGNTKIGSIYEKNEYVETYYITMTRNLSGVEKGFVNYSPTKKYPALIFRTNDYDNERKYYLRCIYFPTNRKTLFDVGEVPVVLNESVKVLTENDKPIYVTLTDERANFEPVNYEDRARLSIDKPNMFHTIISISAGLLFIAFFISILYYMFVGTNTDNIEASKPSIYNGNKNRAIPLSPKDEIISSVIPDGIALDENDLPYIINRKYGYGKQFNAFVTKYSDCYHRSKCPSIRYHKKTVIHRYDAIKRYRPCSFCKPIDHIDGWYKLYLDNKNLENGEEVVIETPIKRHKRESLAERIAPSLQLREEIRVKLDEHIKKYGTTKERANSAKNVSASQKTPEILKKEQELNELRDKINLLKNTYKEAKKNLESLTMSDLIQMYQSGVMSKQQFEDTKNALEITEMSVQTLPQTIMHTENLYHETEIELANLIRKSAADETD